MLLGDRDQLASVEAGSVLGDICDTGGEHLYGQDQAQRLATLCGYPQGPVAEVVPPMADAIALLRRSYRFDDQKGIGRLARQINGGDGSGALETLGVGLDELQWQPGLGPGSLARLLREAADGYAEYLALGDPGQALDAFNRQRILCALRAGPQGVAALNRGVEAELSRRGLLRPDAVFYPGRPVLIARNDFGLKLFNGDVGLVLPDPAAGGDLRAFFRLPDGALRSLAPGRLPEHETVFAMTVHKSQGSEFDRVLLVLPEEPGPVLTRELLYTGITRARNRVRLAATEAVLRWTIERRSQRVSGLRDRIWS
jgi:exodeoxyribonuclease V alpha subunit